jgi:uncharacterized protein (UPF0128 family)
MYIYITMEIFFKKSSTRNTIIILKYLVFPVIENTKLRLPKDLNRWGMMMLTGTVEGSLRYKESKHNVALLLK